MTTRVTSAQPESDYTRRDSRKSLPTISVLTLEIAHKPEKQPQKEEDPDTDVLSDLIGHYGLWQFIWTLMLTLFQLPNTLHIFSLYFQGNAGDFWCARPANMSWIDIDEWRNKTQPDGPCTIRDYRLPSDLDQYGWAAYFNGVQNTAGDLVKCESFEYDNAAETIVAEWNLVCDREILSTYVETCFLTGAAIGSVSSGWLSDRFGRKHTLMTFALVQNVIGTAIAFSNSLPMFMALRLIIGFASMTVTVVSFVLVAELVSGKCRTIIGILNIMPVGLTYTITSGIAYLTKDWRLMQLVIAIPWFAFSFMWFCLPESPRWLLERGRTAELIKIIERAAKMNKRILPTDYEKSLETCPKNEEIVNESPLKVVFNKEFRKTTLLTLVVWFTLILIYMGLTLHIKNMGGDIYLTAALAGIVEAVAVCLSILVVLKLGIKLNLVIYTLISGVACLGVNLVPDSNTWLIILLAMIVKCAIGANNAIIPIFTAKQYPTVIRNFGVGMGNFACGIALMLVPTLWQLESIEKNLPMTVLGISAMIGAVALIFMKQVEGLST